MRPWVRRWSAKLGRPIRRWIKKPYYLYQHWRGAGREDEMSWLAHFVRPGDVVLDVGANVGYYTTRLARLVSSTGRVHAFEPVPETFDVLRFLIARLGLRNVELHRDAVSDVEGEEWLTVPDETPGVANFYLAHLGGDTGSSGERTRVRVVTLDALASRGLSRVSFAKCDVEGAEGRLLRGARRLLERDTPVLLIEVSDMSRRLGDSAADTFGLLHELGYRACYPEGGRLRVAEAPVAGVVNYFFLPRSLPIPDSAAS